MTQPLPPAESRIVLFDGVCVLCHGLVRFLVRIDRRRVLRYAPLQGETAAHLRTIHPEIPDDVDTAVFIVDGQVFVRSRAVFQVLRTLGWPWRALAVLSLLPTFLTDGAYRWVARFRYRVFGQFDTCEIPSPEARDRFLL